MTTQDGAAPTESSIDSQLGWSTSSFRAWPLSGALAEIGGQGFGGIDLGALPVVGDHVPPPLPCDLVDVLTDQTVTSGSAVRLIDAHLAGTQPGRVAAEIPRRLQTLVDPARRLAPRPSCWPVVARAPNCAPDRPAPSPRWFAPSPPPSSSAAPAITSSMSPSPTLCRAKPTSATGRSTSPAVSKRRPTPASPAITVKLETRYITNGPRLPLAPPD